MNVSYTMQIKEELTEIKQSMMESYVLLSAFIRNNGIKDRDKITLSIENPKIMRYIFELVKDIFDCNISVSKADNFKKKVIYNIVITSNVNKIYEDLLIYNDGIYVNKPNEYFVDSEDLKRAYLRGLFLAVGSINDPKTASYHLEFSVQLAYEADFILYLLKFFDIKAKVIDRDKGYMVYVKESEKISDFLRVISANRAVMYFEDIRIYRDHKNMTNRLNNCEQANVDKTIASSKKQINDINLIKDVVGFDLVDDRLKDVMTYRLEYPDVSLLELSEIITLETGKHITKSGVNHRLRKIKEMAANIKKDND